MGWETMAGVGYDGIGVDVITLLLAAGLVAVDEGKPGKISANDTVDLCAAEDVFYGVIDKVDLGTGVASVQRKGFATVPYTGAPGVGYQELVGNGAGGVKPPSPGVKPYLVTGVVANNNAIRFTAKKYGTGEEDINITLIDPPGNNVALSVDVVGRDINVTLATDGSSVITSTAALVIAAIAASSAADLVTAANEGASTGAGVVAAVASTALDGGVDASVGRKVFVANKDVAAGTLVIDLG
jgi:hypothetical protein